MIKSLLILLLLTGSNFSLAKKHDSSSSKYDCIEINKLTVDKENANTRALKRASRIPSEVIKNIQNFMVDEVDLDKNGLKAVNPEETKCKNDETALVLDGVLIDYKKGNRIVRYIVSFGAGKQKIEANLTLTEKATGEKLAKGRVVDRKVAGFAGGSDDKGKRDFAEKVNNFIRKGLKMKKTLRR